MSRLVSRFVLPAALTASIGCVAPADDVGTTAQHVESDNALGMNALTVNALGFNALGFNALGFNALGFNALGFNALGFNALGFNALGFNGESATELMETRPVAYQFFEYLISCAVPEGHSIEIPREMVDAEYAGDGDMVAFQGRHGLAPEWANLCPGTGGGWVPCAGIPVEGELPPDAPEGSMACGDGNGGVVACAEIGAPAADVGTCDETCQQWITACLLARVNAHSQPGRPVSVAISMRGAHPALATDSSEVEQFPVQEGAFWGNIFKAEPELYTCYGVHYQDTNSTLRACTHAGASCPMTIVGPCGPWWNVGAGSVTGFNAVGLAGLPVLDGQVNVTQGYYQSFPLPIQVNNETQIVTSPIGITVYLASPEQPLMDYANYNVGQDIDFMNQLPAVLTATCGNGVCEFGECGAAHLAEGAAHLASQAAGVDVVVEVCPEDCSGCVGDHCTPLPVP
jgi:hypothetical protein